MMARRANARRDAPALRFLLLCVGGWVVLRIMMLWTPVMSVAPDAGTVPWAAPSPFAVSNADPFSRAQPRQPLPRTAASQPEAASLPRLPTADPPGAVGDDALADRPGADRHSLRLALMARLLPPAPGDARRSALESRGLLFPPAPAARAAPGQGTPFWIRQPRSNWSLGSWLYLRDASGKAPGAIGEASQLGGSQAGLRLAYGFGETGRLRAYGRATIAIERSAQREVALGVAFAPLARVPIDLAIEQRVAVGKDGRTALAVMASGGVSEVALPNGFRLDAYAQAGIVGTRRRDGFADGAIIVDRRLGPRESSGLRLGALAAGAVQPGASRVDVGPRLTLRLPQVGEGSRIALDWRQRIAGDAHPESGVALTIAADF